MSQSERDPRINPQPEDVLRGQIRLRSGIVTETRTFVFGPDGTGEFVRYRRQGRGNIHFSETLGMWRRWAADAEVVRRAEKEEK